MVGEGSRPVKPISGEEAMVAAAEGPALKQTNVQISYHHSQIL